MTDSESGTAGTSYDGMPDGEDPDRGLPLFWGFLLVAAVTLVAVLLFRQIDLGPGSTPPTTDPATTTGSTLAEEPDVTTTVP